MLSSKWLLLTGFFLLPFTEALAASVTQVKGKKALLELSRAEDAQVGEEFFAVEISGKRRALLRIVQIKNGRALADIVKGKAQVGHEIVRKGARPISQEVPPEEAEEPGSSPVADAYERGQPRSRDTGAGWGLIGEMLQMDLKVDFTAGTGSQQRNVSAALKGSSFGVSGFYDYPISPALQIRGLAGVEQLKAAGTISTADCEASTNCTFNVSYLSLHGQAKYNFLRNSTMKAWVNGGFGFLLALSKSSTVVDTSSISTDQIYSFGAGADIKMGRKTFLPVSIEYGIFPPSETVKANILFLRVGYGWVL